MGVKRLDDVTFTVNAGEVLGIAGIAGSGQRELLESIAGLYPVASGSVTYYNPENDQPKELVGLNPMAIRCAPGGRAAASSWTARTPRPWPTASGRSWRW